MIDTGRPQPVRAEDVITRLRDRGFACTEQGGHVLAVRDVTRLVLPAPGRILPDRFVRRLDHVLEPVLGRGWRTGEADRPSAGSDDPDGALPADVHLLDAVVDLCPTSGAWCAFLPAELTVMGFGATRHDALSDLKDAAAVWIGVSRASVVLVTPTMV